MTNSNERYIGGYSKEDAQIALSRLVKLNKPHYIYILHRPNGDPFYVGKGQKTRVFDHETEANGTSAKTHKLNIIRSVIRRGEKLRYTIHAAFDCHDDALSEEISLIKSIGRYDQGDGPLTNQTDGGEGGLNPSEDSKERHRQTLAGDGGDDPERTASNQFFANFCDVKSTPIKPISSYGRSVSTLHKIGTLLG